MIPSMPAPAPPLLDGARLRLRAFRRSDIEPLYGIYSDPKVMRYWSYPPWTERSQADVYLSRALAEPNDDGMLAWAIARLGDDGLIGTVALYQIDASQGRAEVGYALGAVHWGHGYAQEAIRLALVYAFEVLRLRRIEADVDPRNVASCRLLERLGFVREGLLRERWMVAGELQDSAIHGLLREELT
jgi:ribosomal-protein-alanine N-acetyltransferase